MECCFRLRPLLSLDRMFNRNLCLEPLALAALDCLRCSIRLRGYYTCIHWHCRQLEETQLEYTKTTSSELGRSIVLIRPMPRATHTLVPWSRPIDSSINREPIPSGECVMGYQYYLPTSKTSTCFPHLSFENAH